MPNAGVVSVSLKGVRLLGVDPARKFLLRRKLFRNRANEKFFMVSGPIAAAIAVEVTVALHSPIYSVNMTAI